MFQENTFQTTWHFVASVFRFRTIYRPRSQSFIRILALRGKETRHRTQKAATKYTVPCFPYTSWQTREGLRNVPRKHFPEYPGDHFKTTQKTTSENTHEITSGIPGRLPSGRGRDCTRNIKEKTSGTIRKKMRKRVDFQRVL